VGGNGADQVFRRWLLNGDREKSARTGKGEVVDGNVQRGKRRGRARRTEKKTSLVRKGLKKVTGRIQADSIGRGERTRQKSL